jgi:hypothetical protein
MEMPARGPTEHRDERRLCQPRHLADLPDPTVTELVGGHGPDAPEALDRQRVQEFELSLRRHEQDAVGLGDAARHLGQELGPRHPDRDGQTDPLEDGAA